MKFKDVNNKKEQSIDDYSLDRMAINYLKELLAIANNSPEYISAVTELYKAICRI